jgi:hypothetical protein
MKNLKSTVGTALLVIGTAAAHANSVILTQNAYSFSQGGEFNANLTQNFLPNYNPQATVGTGFETFCIETTVEFNPGQTYTYDLTQVDSRGVDLTMGAAFLYHQFATGNLAGYNYLDASTRNTDASYLQAAIWWFQGEQSINGWPALVSNPYYNEAITALGGFSNAEKPSDGDFGVDVLQLWNGNSAAQNQLVQVPDATTTSGMLAASFGALAFLRRRL